MLAEFTDLFAAPGVLLLGALTGLVFGFLLQKGGVTDYNVIVGQFLLRDFTMLKIMLSAMVVGGVGIYGMRSMGVDFELHVKTAAILGNAVGGVIFGVGMAILGYCPGTGIAALGDGRRDAIFGVVGMLLGAGLFAEAYPWIKENVLSVGAVGKETLASVTGLSPWWFLVVIVIAVIFGLAKLERWERSRG